MLSSWHRKKRFKLYHLLAPGMTNKALQCTPLNDLRLQGFFLPCHQKLPVRNVYMAIHTRNDTHLNGQQQLNKREINYDST